MMSVYDDLAHRIRGVARHHARTESPPAMRFTVVNDTPLTLDQLGGQLVLTEGDPDFTITDTLDASGPTVGDMVVVEQVGPADNPEWLATHLVTRGDGE